MYKSDIFWDPCLRGASSARSPSVHAGDQVGYGRLDEKAVVSFRPDKNQTGCRGEFPSAECPLL
jgi:hypothetical protein